MPDITMCTNSKCPVRKSCYRCIAPPSTQQSYTFFKVEDGKVVCKHYMANVLYRAAPED